MSSLNDVTQEVITQSTTSRRGRVRLRSLGMRVSERKLLLVIMDLFLLSMALTLSLVVRTELLPGAYALWANVKWYVSLWLLWAMVAAAFDVYDLRRSADPASIVWNVVAAAGITSGIYLLIPWLTPPIQNRSQGYIFIGLAVVAVGIWRILYARLFVQPAFRRRGLVVGAGHSGRFLANAISVPDMHHERDSFLDSGIELVGFVDDNREHHGRDILGIPILGDSSQLLSLVADLDVDEVVIAITHTQSICPELFEAILDCKEMGIPIVNMTTVYERLTGRVAFEHASQNVEVAAGQHESPFIRLFSLVKRLVDFIGALIGMIGLMILIPIVYITNALVAPGPLFFRQRRVGLGGRSFEVIKFRSMVPDAEQSSGAVWAMLADDRITPFGRWLRRTHLDEMPQVINVLKGEMSLVGPRPERPEFVEELSKTIPFYRARHAIRPGITGWAQIHQDYGDSFEGVKEKLGYDLYYVKRAGPVIDTVIILRTFSKVFGFRGR